jgi:Na+/phosphate symporter
VKLLATEPVMTAILAVVTATVALLVTADQREAIEAWVGAVLVLGVAVRSQVTPKAKASQPPPAA